MKLIRLIRLYLDTGPWDRNATRVEILVNGIITGILVVAIFLLVGGLV